MKQNKPRTMKAKNSLMVSSIFEARFLMTFTNCGGATSVTNLAIRAICHLREVVSAVGGGSRRLILSCLGFVKAGLAMKDPGYIFILN
ncbi:hypothetical protein K7X08_022661 [Anisodus acutangulus]|uniref:Uncharacterized protein n=1 Tax=Anisodus acutangulus TaxID=402998 RepID=A0A9Q1MIG3_9SOLA|nr:hypothetical protein K7X08_022661 [Anisodus acutangulus]